MKNKNKTVRCTCAKCNKPMSITVDMQFASEGKVLCKACALAAAKAKERAAIEAERARRDAVAETKTCPDCGKEFPITVGEVEWFKERDMSLPIRCAECRTKRKAQRQELEEKKDLVKETRTCKECGKEFTITFGQAAWYEKRGFQLPGRCDECRNRTRQQKPAETKTASAEEA